MKNQVEDEQFGAQQYNFAFLLVIFASGLKTGRTPPHCFLACLSQVAWNCTLSGHNWVKARTG